MCEEENERRSRVSSYEAAGGGKGRLKTVARCAKNESQNENSGRAAINPVNGLTNKKHIGFFRLKIFRLKNFEF